MKIFSTSGTLGDTFVNLVKLWEASQLEPIQVNHYTVHTNWHPLIEAIYSLAGRKQFFDEVIEEEYSTPNITVNFVDKRDVENQRVFSDFANEDECDLQINPFPNFNYENIGRMRSPDMEYIVIAPSSGRKDQDRLMPASEISPLSRYENRVYIGSNDFVRDYINHIDPEGANLIGKTTLLESFHIIKHARAFWGFQGIHSLVALCHCVPATIYFKDFHEEEAILNRIHPEWRRYLRGVLKVKCDNCFIGSFSEDLINEKEPPILELNQAFDRDGNMYVPFPYCPQCGHKTKEE